MIVSELREGTVRVPFPEHTSERIYMVPFTQASGLPERYRRWQDTVDAMLDGVDAPGEIYIMVDQRIVRANNSHRRPGVHIDGWWIPAGPHPGDGFRSLREVGVHGTGRHGTSLTGKDAPPPPKKKENPDPTVPVGRHRAARHISSLDCSGRWPEEAIILASDLSACRSLLGTFEGEPGVGGDCHHLDISGAEEVVYASHRAYSGNVTNLHESMVIPFDCVRTVVRLNVPGVYM
jgi:hypothetical protein